MAKIVWEIGKVSIKVLGIFVVLGIIFWAVQQSLTASVQPTQPNNQADTLEQTAKTHIQNKQYAKAEQVYNNIIQRYPRTDYEFRAFKDLIILYIQRDNVQSAEETIDALIDIFSGSPNIAEALLEIGRSYSGKKKDDEALQLHEYNVKTFSNEESAMWSQTEIVYSYTRKGDNAAAEAAINKLLTNYAEQENIARAVCQIADQYYKLHKHRNADMLYQKVVKNWPGGEYAMWSQMHIAISNIRDGNDIATQSSIDKLIANYSRDEQIAIAVCLIADSYNEQHKYDKADILYLHILNNWPDTEHGMWAQMHIAMSNIRDGNETATLSFIDKLVSDYAEQENIARAVCQIADQYYKLHKHRNADMLYQKVVKNWPDNEYAMWSQMHIAISNIRDGNDTVAESATNKLIADYAEQKDIALAVWQVAKGYEQSNKYDKALELNQYNVEHFSKSEHAMWSQSDIICFHINTGNMESARNSIDILITKFAKQETLPKEICNVAEYYAGAGMSEKATKFYQKGLKLYQKTAKTSPTIWTKTGIARANIRLGNIWDVATTVDEIIAEFPDYPDLPEAVLNLAKEYYKRADLLKDNEEAKRNFQIAKTIAEEKILNLPGSVPSSIAAEACLYMAYCDYKLGQHEDALQNCEKVIDDWSDYSYTHYAQLLKAGSYKGLLYSGTIPASEANLQIEQALMAVLEKEGADNKSIKRAMRELDELILDYTDEK